MLRGGQSAPGSNRMALVYECFDDRTINPDVQSGEPISVGAERDSFIAHVDQGLVVGAVICNGQQRSAVVPGAEPQVESATALSNFESALDMAGASGNCCA